MTHEHEHASPFADARPAFAIGVVLNLVYVAVEGAFGFLSSSLALLADAGHNLSDVLGLALGWAAVVLAAKAPTARRTYGMRKSTILAALGNSLILCVAVVGIVWEAIHRFSNPQPVPGSLVMIVAGIGIVVNAATTFLFYRSAHRDLNAKGAFLHMAADTLVSLGVVVVGLTMTLTGQNWIDPAASLVVAVVIAWGSWSLVRQSLNMALDAVPEEIEPTEVKTFLARQPEVTDVHDLHIWPVSTTSTALTAHLVCPKGVGNDFFRRMTKELHKRFEIDHPTLQVEKTCESNPCAPTKTRPY